MARQPIDDLLFELGFANKDEFLRAVNAVSKKAGDDGGKVFQGAFLGSFSATIATEVLARTSQAFGEFAREVQQRAGEIENENIKIAQVFGASEQVVRQWAAANREALGLSTQQTATLAAATQDLLVPMGFQRDEALKLTTQTIDLAAALAAWDTQQRSSKEISDILTKAYLGEREQLKSLGISIGEADVKARLLAKSQNELTGEALQQAKALATLELITEKSSDAQVAFANNTDTAARAQAQMKSSLADSRDELANNLIPVMASFNNNVAPVFVQAQANIISAFNDLVVAIFNVETQFQQSVRGILNQVNEANREGVQALSDEIQRQTDLAAKYQQQIEILTPSAERNLAIIDAGAKQQLAKASQNLIDTQSNLAFLNGELEQILAQESIAFGGNAPQGVLTPPPVVNVPTGASVPSSTSSVQASVTRSADVVEQFTTRVGDYYRLLGEKREADLISQKTYNDEVASLIGRLTNEYRYIQDQTAAGNITPEAALAYATQQLTLLNEMNAAIAQTAEVVNRSDFFNGIQARRDELNTWRNETREYIAELGEQTEAEALAYQEVRAEFFNSIQGRREQLNEWRNETRIYLQELAEQQQVEETAYQETRAAFVNSIQERREQLNAWRLEGATYQQELEAQAAAEARASQEAASEFSKGIQARREQLNQWRLELRTYQQELVAVEALAQANAVREFTNGIQKRREQLNQWRLENITAQQDMANAEIAAQNAAKLAFFQGIQERREQLAQWRLEVITAQQEANALVNIGVPNIETNLTNTGQAFLDAKNQLENDLYNLALDFPTQLALGIKNGDVVGALKGALDNAADFFIRKLVEGILGDVASSLASSVAKASVGQGAGAAGAGLAAGGPLAIFALAAAGIFGLVSAIAPSNRDTRLADFGVGSDASRSGGRTAASISQTAAVTINVSEGTSLSTPQGRAEVAAIAKEQTEILLARLGLVDNAAV